MTYAVVDRTLYFLEDRHATLETRFAEQLRRLPAIRDGMRKAGSLW